MKYDFRFGPEERKLLQSVVGKRLESYRLNDSDNTSFEIFVLRFQDTDIEIATEEISCGSDWFDETNVVKALEKPNRDSWSRVGETKPYNGIPSGQFLDYSVGKIVTGISAIVESLASGDEMGEFVRGIVVDVRSESIVFDKGALNWECIWRVRSCAPDSVDIPQAEFDPVEEPGLSSTMRIERLA